MRVAAQRSALLATVCIFASAAQAQSAPSAATDSSEIVVTASKRAERALDVPTSITAFKGSDLLKQGYTRLQDYLTLTPGVQFNQALGSGAPVVRGLNTGADVGALVGLVVDGAPIGGSSAYATGGIVSLDLDPIDLERVEVLKGPQGTLYGANTLGGLVSYVLAKPDLDKVSVLARGELSGTEDGGTNYSIRGAASVPLIKDQLAVRLSGYVDRPAGFVDNNVAGIDNQNRQRNWGVNGSVLFEPAPGLTIKLDGLYQRVNERAKDDVIYGNDGKPRDGDLTYNDYLFPDFSKRVRAGIGTIDYDLGFAKLSSITSYQKSDAFYDINATNSSLGTTLPLLPAFGGQPVPAPGLFSIGNHIGLKKVTEEVRLTSSGSGPFQYVAGLFYTHEDIINTQDITGRATDRSAVPTLDPAIGFDVRSTYREYAGFANVTYKFTNSLDVTGGIRVGRIEQSYRQLFGGSDADAYNALLGVLLGASPTPADTGTSHASKTIVNYLATARYHFSPDGMVYARFATGFRPGGPNVDVAGLPPTYNPDRTENYEAGIKTKFLDGHGTIEAAGYYMNWKDILISVASGSLTGLSNGGRARIYGGEATLTLQPVTGLSLIGSMSYNHAEITKVDPAAAIAEGKGDPLPNSAKWSGSLSAQYRTPVSGDWAMVLGATARFVGARHAYLRSNQTLKDWIMPHYTLVDLRAGMESPHFDVDLFVRNLTNKRAQLSALTNFGLNEITIQRPRTIGAAVTFKY